MPPQWQYVAFGETAVFQENEVIALLIGLGGGIFCVANSALLRTRPNIGLLLTGFAFGLAGWFMTVGEGLIWPNALNIAEHLFYVASALCVALWSWRISESGGKDS